MTSQLPLCYPPHGLAYTPPPSQMPFPHDKGSKAKKLLNTLLIKQILYFQLLVMLCSHIQIHNKDTVKLIES